MSEDQIAAKDRVRPADGEADPKAFGGAHLNINKLEPVAPPSVRSYNAIITSTTTEYLAKLDPDDPPHPWTVEADLLKATNAWLRLENTERSRDAGAGADFNTRNHLSLLKTLTASQVAQILVTLHRVVRLVAAQARKEIRSDHDSIAMYVPLAGIYVRSEDTIRTVAARYNSGTGHFYKDVLTHIRVQAPNVTTDSAHQWAAVANGDYHRATRELHPFSPERVFLSRVPVAYVPDAPNPIIRNEHDGTVWDVDSGILAIANNDSGTEAQLWDLFAAVAQPGIRTNKAVALYNRTGNNGKGTVIQVCRGLAGEENTLSASIGMLSRDTTLPLLAGKSLVVSDENATNDFVKNAETIKQLSTREPIVVNPKYLQPYNLIFEGTQVHCLNELPRFADRSDSMWRRWHFISLTAEFEGRERKYIKDDYLRRPEVLEYILRRALHADFSMFSETESSLDLLRDAKIHNDAARQFWSEHEHEFQWDLLPLEMLYELFKGWFERNKPGGRISDRSTFDQSIRSAVKDSAGEWVDVVRGKPKKASVHMLAKEPLLGEYGLSAKWNKVDRSKQFRNAIYRDRAASALAAADAARPADASTPGGDHFTIPSRSQPEQTPLSPSDRHRLLERLVADDLALWERRAFEDDGVTDIAHRRAHAEIRSMGSGCACSYGPQARYDDALIRATQDLQLALQAARADHAEENVVDLRPAWYRATDQRGAATADAA